MQMHVAESREQAIEDVRFGFEQWVDYLGRISAVPVPARGSHKDDLTHAFIDSGACVIGTPDDAIAMIERLQEKQGEFGVMLFQSHNWADWEETKKSYELYARFVMPHFAGTNRNRQDSYNGLTAAIDRLESEREKGAAAAFKAWEEKTGRKG